MKKPISKKIMLISLAILIIAVGIGGNIIFIRRGLDGGHIAVLWLLYFVAIIGLVVFVCLIIRPIIRSIQGKDDPPPEFANRPPPNV